MRLPGKTILFITATAVLRVKAAMPEDAVGNSLKKLVLPVLGKQCFDCHDADKAKGGLNLDIFTGTGAGRFDIRLWDKVREQLQSGSMPPKDKPQPTSEERQGVLAWIVSNEKAVLATSMTDPGTRKVRRLTRHEYNCTLRDLLGVTVQPGDDFPADGAGGEGFENNSDTLFIPPLLIEKYLSGAEAALAEVFGKPELKVRIFEPIQGRVQAGEASASALIAPFLMKAFRRPVSDDETKPFISVFNDAIKRGAGFEDSVKTMLKGVLVSPGFLLLREQNRPDLTSPWRVGDYEMASRLSYFLWSSMPDDELFRLAAGHRLQDDAILEAQTKRMLSDPRSGSLVRHFAGVWLNFEELFNNADPDRGRFKEYTDSLRQSMFDEALEFSSNILCRDGCVLDFLDSDYSFINETLARLYDIPGVQGPQLRRVKFTDNRRGGLLGMGAILTTTSYPRRTSPVLRGKWVLEKILGTPPHPPPQDVPKIPEDDQKLNNLTVRQSFEKHRSNKACASCHARLDPPGFGLEHFDAIGRWRDLENGKSIDSSGVMPDGRTFDGAAEFRKILMEQKAQFIRTLCSRLLGYALNRGLEIEDQPTLLGMEEALKKADFHSGPMIVTLVKSHSFRYRRN